jgi:ABC-type multidrug transport system fused ATPase/permease subunit
MLRKRIFLSFSAVGISGLTAAAALWWNARLGGIIDCVGKGCPPSGEMLIWALAAMLAMCLTNYTKGYLTGYACERMSHDLRLGYARYFSGLPFADAEGLNAGELLSKLQNEIAGVSGYLQANLFRLLDDGVRFVFTFIWLLRQNPMLTLGANLPAFIIVAYIFFSSKIIGAAAEKAQQAKGCMNQYADTLLALFPIIKLYDGLRLTRDGYVGAVKTWEDHSARMEYTRARLMSLSGLLSKVPLLLLFLFGGKMAISGAITVGTLYIFLNLSGSISGVFMNMPGFIAAFRQFSANMNRLSPYILFAARGTSA